MTKGRKRRSKRMVKIGLRTRPTKKNKEDFPSYERTDQENFIIMLLTNQLTDTFYVKAKSLTQRAIELHKKMVKSPEFYAKALKYARNYGYQRLQPQIGLVNLSTEDIRLFGKIFKDVCRIPTDLRDVIDFSRADIFREGLGSGVKKVINNWLKEKLSEYYALKYRDELKDAIRMARPSEEFLGKKADIANWIMGREPIIGGTLPQIEAFERLKCAKRKSTRIKLIREGRLPHEIVTPFIRTSDEWKTLARNMPIFALIRHLNTLRRHGCLNDPVFVGFLIRRLMDEKTILDSKMFPFRFYDAYKMLRKEYREEDYPDRDYSSRKLDRIPMMEDDEDKEEEDYDEEPKTTKYTTPEEVLDALAVSYATSFKNLPIIRGETMVILDVSGSMDGKFKEIAATLGLGIASRCRNKYIICFDNRLYRVNLKSNPLQMIDDICNTGGGGTNLTLPIEYMIQHNIEIDNIIVISDMEEWLDTGFVDALRRYKSSVSPDIKTFLINVSPYEDFPTPSDEPNVYTIGGWSEQVISYMSAVSLLDEQVERIGREGL